jgi:hypothetical protein
MTSGPLTSGCGPAEASNGCRGPGRHSHRTPLGLEPVAVSTKLACAERRHGPQRVHDDQRAERARLSTMDCERGRGHGTRAALTAGSVGRGPSSGHRRCSSLLIARGWSNAAARLMIGDRQSPGGPRLWDGDPRATEEYGEDVAPQDPGHEFGTVRPKHRTRTGSGGDQE